MPLYEAMSVTVDEVERRSLRARVSVAASSRLGDVALAVVAVVFGGVVTGAVGLGVATVAIVLIGARAAGSVGAAVSLIVFCGAVSASHYGFGSAEWTEASDRAWAAFAAGAAIVLVAVSPFGLRSWRAAAVVAIPTTVTFVVVDARLGVRGTSALVMGLIVLLAVVAFERRRRFDVPIPVLRFAIDLTLGVGVALDIVHDLVGGFGGRGPERFGFERWIGTTLDPNEFGELALLALGLTLVLLSRRSERVAVVLPRVAGYCALVAASGSRTSLGLLAVMLVAAALAMVPTNVRVFGLAGVAAACVLIVVFWSSIEPRLTGFEPTDDLRTLNGRTEIWDIALDERLESPVTALGFGGSEEYFRGLYATTRPVRFENISTHNRVLEAWAALGIHGALILVGIWAISLVRARELGAIALIVVVMSIASSMMVPGFGSLRPGAWLLVPLALMAAHEREAR